MAKQKYYLIAHGAIKSFFVFSLILIQLLWPTYLLFDSRMVFDAR